METSFIRDTEWSPSRLRITTQLIACFFESARQSSPALLEETQRPDRVRIILPMVSLLPDASIAWLRHHFGPRLDRFDKLEIQALVTADLEGQVTNTRLRQMSAHHPSDVTKVLQGLVAGGFLEKSGQARATLYYLPGTRSTRAPYTDELFTSGNSPITAAFIR